MDEKSFRNYVGELDTQVSRIYTPPENFREVCKAYSNHLCADIDGFLGNNTNKRFVESENLLVIMELNVRFLFLKKLVTEENKSLGFIKHYNEKIDVNDTERKLTEMNQLLNVYNKYEENFSFVFLNEAENCYMFIKDNIGISDFLFRYFPEKLSPFIKNYVKYIIGKEKDKTIKKKVMNMILSDESIIGGTMMSNQLKGLLYGFITADALGVPFEFRPRGSFKMTEMTGYGTYNKPPGTWSDDSSMLLCTVEQLYKHESLEYLMDLFTAYAFHDYMTPEDETFDIGMTTMDACNNRKYLGRPAEQCGVNSISANGNGSVMRIAPVIVLTHDQPLEEKYRIVKAYSSLTHAHEQSVVGCLIYILLLENIMSGCPKVQLMSHIEQQLQQLDVDYSVYSRLFDGIETYAVEDIQSSGYVVHSLEAAVYCYLNYETFTEGVFAAINLGEDTDTIGALTGALYGAETGYSDEIDGYKQQLINQSLVDKHVNHFLHEF